MSYVFSKISRKVVMVEAAVKLKLTDSRKYCVHKFVIIFKSFFSNLVL